MEKTKLTTEDTYSSWKVIKSYMHLMVFHPFTAWSYRKMIWRIISGNAYSQFTRQFVLPSDNDALWAMINLWWVEAGGREKIEGWYTEREKFWDLMKALTLEPTNGQEVHMVSVIRGTLINSLKWTNANSSFSLPFLLPEDFDPENLYMCRGYFRKIMEKAIHHVPLLEAKRLIYLSNQHEAEENAKKAQALQSGDMGSSEEPSQFH